MVAQIFVIERTYSYLNSSLCDVLAESRTNASGETSNAAAHSCGWLRAVLMPRRLARGHRLAGS